MLSSSIHEITSVLPYLFKVGMVFSLELTGLAAVFGILLGTLLAVCRMSDFRMLSVPATLYVNGMRSVPLLLIIFSDRTSSPGSPVRVHRSP